MQKNSFLFLLILTGVALIGAYSALFPLPSGTMLIRFFALSALFIISVSLMIGPLATIDPKYAPLVEPRRAIGIAGFLFAALHILLVLALTFGWDISLIFGVLSLQLAVPATLVLLAMALTSSDWAVQKMGMGNWKKLQMLIYPTFALLLAHFVLMSNGLFAKTQAGTFLNLSEAAVLAIAFVAIAMQLYGFYLKRKRMPAASPPPAA